CGGRRAAVRLPGAGPRQEGPKQDVTQPTNRGKFMDKRTFAELFQGTGGDWTVGYDGSGRRDSVKKMPESKAVYVEPIRINAGRRVLATLRCFAVYNETEGDMRVDLAERQADANLLCSAKRMAEVLVEARGLLYHLGFAAATDLPPLELLGVRALYSRVN